MKLQKTFLKKFIFLILSILIFLSIIQFISDSFKTNSSPKFVILTTISNNYVTNLKSSNNKTFTSFVDIKWNGRTGNQMFQYAAMLALSIRCNRTALLPKFHYFSQVFETTVQTEDLKEILRNRVHLNENKIIFHDKNAYIFEKNFNTFNCSNSLPLLQLDGYFLSWKYFSNISYLIRKQFKFKEKISKEALLIHQQALTNLNLLNNVKFSYHKIIKVAIHIRRKDMLLEDNIKMGYTIAPLSYFKRSVKYFINKFASSKIIFIVSCDDFEWCQLNLNSLSDIYILNSKTPDLISLAVLTYCNHSIISAGSFGWWGAYLAGGITIYYKDFPRRGSTLATVFKKEDYYPSDWISY